MKQILNIGCGNNKEDVPFRGKIIGIDRTKLRGVDIVHDLNSFPWPIKNNQFDYVYASHVLEHLEDIVKPLEEIYRISKPSAIVKIIVPLFPGVWTFADPTHKQAFTYMSFNYFEKSHGLNYYSHARFKILKRKILFHKLYRFMEFINISEFLRKGYYVFFSQIIPPKVLEITLRVEK
ncbi:MAG: class I SAM-dependent methyltransferase [Nanoarchaeota archaeon]|nr:class I SAM-dependent methyltransferase [Nanoarchaeota archaeon]